MTVGGGFTGLVLTLQLLAQMRDTALIVLCIVFALLHAFVVASGLLLVHNPHRVMPLVAALTLQIPVISSPLVAYRFGDGLSAGFGFSTEQGLIGWVNFGSDWHLNVMQPLPWGSGINVVPVVLLGAMRYSMRKNHRPATSSEPA